MCEKTIKVSVVVPVHNGISEGLRECLDSITNQDYPDKEVILVDDASSDNSYRIMQEYAVMPFWNIVRHSQNEGLAASLNDGIKSSTGDLILLIHQDCMLLEKCAISESKAFLDSDPTIGVLVGRQVYDFSNMNFYQRFMEFRLEHIYLNIRLQGPIDLAENKCDLVRRKIIESVGYFDTAFKISGEDFIFSSRVIATNAKIYEGKDLKFRDSHIGESSLIGIIKKDYTYGKFSLRVFGRTHKEAEKKIHENSYTKLKTINRVTSLLTPFSIVAIFLLVYFGFTVVAITFIVILIARLSLVLLRRNDLLSKNTKIDLPIIRTITSTIILDLSFSIGFIVGIFTKY